MHDSNRPTHDHPVHPVATSASTLTTFVVLMILTVVALWVGFSVTGPYKVLASLIVAGIQTAVLSIYFMDLRNADKLTWLCVGAAVFWVGLLFLFILTDQLTRHLSAL